MHLAQGLFNFFWRQPDLEHSRTQTSERQKKEELSHNCWSELLAVWQQTFWERASLVTMLEGFTGERMWWWQRGWANTGRCPLPGSTYFLPFVCPPSVEWTRRGLAGALWLRSSVWVALGLSGYFVCSQLTAHISPPHALATGHRALKGQECVSGSFGSFGGGRDHRGGEGHRAGDRIPNPMTLTAITRLSNFQWKGPKRMS